jgi:hypothetical protein
MTLLKSWIKLCKEELKAKMEGHLNEVEKKRSWHEDSQVTGRTQSLIQYGFEASSVLDRELSISVSDYFYFVSVAQCSFCFGASVSTDAH